MKPNRILLIAPMVLVSVIGITLVASATVPSNPSTSPTPQSTATETIENVPAPTSSSSPSEETRPTDYPTSRPVPSPSESHQSFKRSYTCGEDGMSLCKVGEQGPGGGTIFFVDYNLEHEAFDYLEAAPYSCIARVPLVDVNMNQVGALQTAKAKQIGSGPKNTELLARLSESGPADYAVNLQTSTDITSTDCRRDLSASLVMASDWFLPSSTELGLLLGNLRFQYPAGNAFYISSTMVHKDEVTAGQEYRDHFSYYFSINASDMTLSQNVMGFEPESTSTWPIRSF